MKEYKLYKGKVLIKFDEEDNANHRFYDEKGNRIPSVTQITGIIDKSSALMGWVAKLIGEYLRQEKAKGNNILTDELIDTALREYRRVQKEARDVGKEIHKWISDWILGKKPPMPEDLQIVNGITAFLKFQKENGLKWVDSERPVYSKKWNYAGFLDAIAQKGKDRILIDFKSSNGIYPEMIFQVMGYKIAWEEEMQKKIHKAMILRFGKETGEFETRELKIEKEDEKAFLGLLEAAKKLKQLK